MMKGSEIMIFPLMLYEKVMIETKFLNDVILLTKKIFV